VRLHQVELRGVGERAIALGVFAFERFDQLRDRLGVLFERARRAVRPSGSAMPSCRRAVAVAMWLTALDSRPCFLKEP
jgi:hypothetical protein